MTAIVALAASALKVTDGPHFPDGDVAGVWNYVQANLEYPKAALEQKLKGGVRIRLHISKTGKVLGADVVKSTNPIFEAAALKVARSMPNFHPATDKGVPVAGQFVFWVDFNPNRKKKEVPKEDTSVYEALAQMPSYPGGEEALLEYVKQNMNYPQSCKSQGIEGNVEVKFVVNKTGNVGDVVVTKSVNKLLDAEAVRLCKSLPKFYAGRKDGKPVNAWYKLTVRFSLGTKESAAKASSSKDDVKLPQFPGGIEALNEFFEKNMRYPAYCAENDIEGTVVVKVEIAEDGSVGSAVVFRSVHRLLDKEAARVCSMLPKFEPGLVNGKPASFKLKIPVGFYL